MIKSIQFTNFRALRDTTLPLGPLTLLIGPNGSGKSSVFTAIKAFGKPLEEYATTGHHRQVSLDITVDNGEQPVIHSKSEILSPRLRQNPSFRMILNFLAQLEVYSFDPTKIAASKPLERDIQLAEDGSNLAGVLQQLSDDVPERFAEVNAQLQSWIPEYDQILFYTPQTGHRAIKLRQKESGGVIPAADLSQGTLLALALLTLAYLPKPPAIIGIEEPDRGLHPRLMRSVRDALYRLAYPKEHGEDRAPVQVIVTTHSPYLLDLFRDHPEEIVIAEKTGAVASFKRLVDIPHYEEILGDASLGDAWYTGVFGGVPAHT